MILAAWLALATAAPAPCTLDSATPASVRDMARDPDRWLGRCVRVEGYVSGNRFFADVAGAYAAEASNADARPNDGWLGLYFADWTEGPAALRRGTISGIVHDCERNYRAMLAEAEPDTIVMSLGYCHYRGGLNLQWARFRDAGPARFEHQIGPTARALFGDLIEATADRGAPPEATGLADRFLAALRASDGTALQAMVGTWTETFERGSEDERGFHAWLLGEGGSPLADLRAMAGQPQRAWFVERHSSGDREFGYRDSWHVCFCRSADCTDRWPIATADAVAHPERPYFCLRTIARGSLYRPEDRLSVNRDDNGFAEPDR